MNNIITTIGQSLSNRPRFITWNRFENLYKVRLSWKHSLEIYPPSKRCWYPRVNSTWIARTFGECVEASYGDVWVYRGILGNHYDV